MKSKSGKILLVFCVCLLFGGVARGETFYAYLHGAQEVPPVATNATGYARVHVNQSTMTLTFTVVFTGLSSNQTASHIHAPAPIGANVGVAINFGAVGGTSGTITGSTSITATQLAQIRAHQGYVNVHSANFVGGEIRGQLGIKRPVDFDGDGRQDYSILRFPNIAPPGVSPITYWNLNSTTGVQGGQEWGNANTDFPAPGDYDGDGKDDHAIYRRGASAGQQSHFWILNSSNSVVQGIPWGSFGDQAVARDYDADGITDAAVFRRGAVAGAQAFWYIRRSTDGVMEAYQWGTTGNGITSLDTAVPGDYDGDGKFDVAVYRFGLAPDNHLIYRRSSDGGIAFVKWGNFSTDWIVPGDYDGDGRYEIAAVRIGSIASDPMIWYILHANGTQRAQQFGISSDVPAQGDYDGDARTDIAIYRAGTTGNPSFFWVFNSLSNSALGVQWGNGGDFAVNTFDTR